MANQWFIARNNKKHGPFTAAKLKELASQGQVLPTDMVWKEGMQKWVVASTVDGLFVPQVVPPSMPAVSAETEKGSPPFVVPDIRQLATSGSLPPALIGVGAVLAPPLGLYCIWKHPRWTVQQKWVWAGAAALVLLLGLFLIPRVVLAFALLSGCALALGLVWTHTGLTLEQKRLWMSVSGLVGIIGLTVVFLAGHGSDGRGLSGESRGSRAADNREARGQGENGTAERTSGLTKAEFRKQLARKGNRFPSKEAFLDTFGQPDETGLTGTGARSNPTKYWIYRCKDGSVKIILNYFEPGEGGPMLIVYTVQDVN